MAKLRPDDPRVLEEVLRRIQTMSDEEVLERARSHSGFDEAWVRPNGISDGVPTTSASHPRRRPVSVSD